MKPLSLDLRHRIVQAVVAQQQSPREVAERFAVSLATVNRYVYRARTNRLTPTPIPGRPRRIGPEQHAVLWAQLTAHADSTLGEHVRFWAKDQGVTVSESTLSRAIRRLGWTRKKRHWQPPNGVNPPGTTGESRSPTAIPSASSSWMNPVPTSA